MARLGARRRGVVVEIGSDAWCQIGTTPITVQSTEEVPLPPHHRDWQQVEGQLALPATSTDKGDTTFAFDAGTVTTSNAVLHRMTRRGIATAKAFEAGGEVFLVGTTDDFDSVVVVGTARLTYDPPSSNA